jgi:hypothetical protein
MRILGLPGNHPSTYAWMADLVRCLETPNSFSYIQRYACWHERESDLDLHREAAAARSLQPDLVIAKSIGTLVALEAFSAHRAKPCFVFLGTPLKCCSNDQLAVLRDFVDAADVLLIQQAKDRTGHALELRSMLPATRHQSVKEIPGSDHRYSDTPLLKSLIEDWWGRRLA